MSVRAIDLVGRLQGGGFRLFTTADVRTLTGLKPAAATHALARLGRAGLTFRLKRGVWALRQAPGLGPFEAVAHLAEPWPAYVSLHSALAHHGLISEIPHLTYAITAGPARQWRTGIGRIDFHHLAPFRCFGFAPRQEGVARFLLADREKAFLDTLYLSLIPRSQVRMPPRRSGRWPLNRTVLLRHARRFAYPPLLARLKAMGLG